jgi:NADH-quinone oxidoreductase subunit C
MTDDKLPPPSNAEPSPDAKPAGENVPQGQDVKHPDEATEKAAPAHVAAGEPAELPNLPSAPAAAAGGALTSAPVERGLFGVSGSGDTSGMGGLVRRRALPVPAERPYGGYFDETVDALVEAFPKFHEAIEMVSVDRGELTLYIKREFIAEVCQTMRDDEALRYELCSSVSGVDYLGEARRLHVTYHLTSMTYRRRVRLEVAVTAEDPHVPSVTKVYPTADWQERETYDMFGIVFDGHPNLTRILMPDDWEGFPQRKDYPLGGVPVEYKGAEIPPPDERRAYK